MMPANLILNIVSYKASHYLQYPQNAEYISAYIEARGGTFKKLMFFCLQAFLKEYLTKPISMTDIEEAEDFLKLHGLPFNKQGWLHIYNKHGGFLPLKIEAVAEGQILPVSNVLLQVVNTNPKCLWLTCYVETALLRGVWYPTTVATLSFHCKSIIKKFLVETSENIEDIDFKLHDFGARSATSLDSAALGGMAHLVNFRVSDTIAGMSLLAGTMTQKWQDILFQGQIILL